MSAAGYAMFFWCMAAVAWTCFLLVMGMRAWIHRERIWQWLLGWYCRYLAWKKYRLGECKPCEMCGGLMDAMGDRWECIDCGHREATP